MVTFAVPQTPATRASGPRIRWVLMNASPSRGALRGIAASGMPVRSLCLAWFVAAAYLMHGIGRRAAVRHAVLTIDERGILDRRLMSKRIGWHEIESICPVNIHRSHVVDLRLRWPDITLSGTRLPIYIGATCQKTYGVPAMTISMLLLDGHVGDLLAAIARYRPDLVPASNRQSYRNAAPRHGERWLLRR